MLTFDDKKYSVSFNNQSFLLQPLSFKLLQVLAQSPEQLVTIEDIASKVWSKATISPETIKQRVFVLRKAIDASGVNGLSIQSVRGEGYRLLIEQPELSYATKKSMLPKMVSMAATLSLLVLAISYISSSGYISNNRVVLWTNIPTIDMPSQGVEAFEIWRNVLNNKNEKGDLQLLFSERMPDMLIPQQAKENKAGLISNFDWVELQGQDFIRLSIIEPRTATVLRSNLVNVTEKQQLLTVMESHLKAMKALISSEKLCLTRSQQNSSQDRIWGDLKAIANQS